jgi:vacuolar-type H+-ATPase subunit H
MVEKHLDAIRAKEGEARERLEATAGEAEIILEKARTEGEKLIEDTKISGNELRRSMTAGAKQEAEKEIEALRAESAKMSAALEDVAGGNRDKALELIIRTFRQGL